MASKRFLRIYLSGNVTVLNLGDMEIWDGSDLARLRDTFLRINSAEKRPSIGIDMSHVKSIPSGFFGTLYDWYEAGVQIRLYGPQPNVRQMMWFSHFFAVVADNCYMLCPNSAVLQQVDPPADPAARDLIRFQSRT